jgi:hypothetical protein
MGSVSGIFDIAEPTVHLASKVEAAGNLAEREARSVGYPRTPTFRLTRGRCRDTLGGAIDL